MLVYIVYAVRALSETLMSALFRFKTRKWYLGSLSEMDVCYMEVLLVNDVGGRSENNMCVVCMWL